MRPILPAFAKFHDEGVIIGRLLAGYTVLEIDLLNCVQMVLGDFDTVLKALFRVRGEARRIDVGAAHGNKIYAALGLGAEFDQAIAAMRHCRVIRNQYAHCNFWDDNSNYLAFANLEDAARQSAVVADLTGLVPRHVDVPLLEAQEAFYVYTDSALRYVNFEGRKRGQKLGSHPFSMPPRMTPPPLHIP